ncbi:hypothetical protein [Burkholderia pseudomultivorans]|uniref:Lipoprotein n=1 Tax=Burkholderia pseudomultivorans TaxID=1207504 RepID=A0ABU2E3N0_9BURK|nr:hypothetical protein [Burkholderia pseudomultivorans]MDR8737045.1 hypothetical protein [Burkholderia pseudomultivorans]MDR8743060.1 hypothetical protein [Burkholderia pseudomultivorans]MDR8754434.1 hypothetical protein [Burkholderia pseudomultivorans]MDR8779787.1 hypothetical protein [Burkholderia pseudomultivorans]MDR8818346.1 hypothetical protein [Burkholderia pseudomultivorans]
MNAILLRRCGGARRVRAALAICVLGALLAGCGGDDSGSPATAAAAAAKTNAAPAGAGGASAPVAIVVAPGAGPCPASGTAALQSPSLNSQLRCAP